MQKFYYNKIVIDFFQITRTLHFFFSRRVKSTFFKKSGTNDFLSFFFVPVCSNYESRQINIWNKEFSRKNNNLTI